MVSPGLQHRGIGRGVGLRAGVRLHVDMLAAEDLPRAVAGQVLDDVGVLAATVVAAPGIALGIFIGEDRAGCFKHCFRDKVFAGNHLQPLVLAESFVVNGGGNFGIGLGEGQRHAVSHTRILSHSRIEGIVDDVVEDSAAKHTRRMQPGMLIACLARVLRGLSIGWPCC